MSIEKVIAFEAPYVPEKWYTIGAMRAGAPILKPKGDLIMPTKKTAKKNVLVSSGSDLGRRI